MSHLGSTSLPKLGARYGLIFLLTALFVFVALHQFSFPLTGIDDANIFFVYAKNLVAGHGLVYNAGGERVEGFSSLLWMLICSLAFTVSSHPELLLIIINTALISLAVTAAITCLPSAFALDDQLPATRLLGVAFLVLLYSRPAFVVWTTIALMAGGLWSSLLLVTTCSLMLADRRSMPATNKQFAVLLPLLLLSRPESLLWGVAFLSGLVVIRLPRRGIGGALKSIMVPFLAYGFTASGMVVFRLLYFGFPLPNTFYAKVSPSWEYNFLAGGRYLLGYLWSNPVATICALAAPLGVLGILYRSYRDRRPLAGPALLPFIALLGLLIPVLTGGDFFGDFRFYQYVYPLLVLNLLYCMLRMGRAGAAWSWLGGRRRLLRVAFCGVIAIPVLWIQFHEWRYFPVKSRFAHEFILTQYLREQSRIMAGLFARLPRYPSVGVISAGASKFHYPGEIVDLMGLNNVRMAHNEGMRMGLKSHSAFEKTTFFELRPEMVAVGLEKKKEWRYLPGRIRYLSRVYLKGLFDDPSFQDAYVYVMISAGDVEDDCLLVGWVLRDFLSALDPQVFDDLEVYDYPAP